MSKLREIREARGVKQKAVAKYIGVSNMTYGGYEKDPSKIRLEQAEKICEFLHCKMSDIFFD